MIMIYWTNILEELEKKYKNVQICHTLPKFQHTHFVEQFWLGTKKFNLLNYSVMGRGGQILNVSLSLISIQIKYIRLHIYLTGIEIAHYLT